MTDTNSPFGIPRGEKRPSGEGHSFLVRGESRGSEYPNAERMRTSEKRPKVYQSSKESAGPDTGETRSGKYEETHGEKLGRHALEKSAKQGREKWDEMERELRARRFPTIPPSWNLQDEFIISEEVKELRASGNCNEDQFYATFSRFVDARRMSDQRNFERTQPQTYYNISEDKSASSASGQASFKKRRRFLSEDTGGLRDTAIGDQYFSQRIARIAQGELIYSYSLKDDLPVDGEKERAIYTVNLSTMQRMNLHAIQKDIVRLAAEIHNSHAWTLPDVPIIPDIGSDRRYRERLEAKLSNDHMAIKVLMREYCNHPLLAQIFLDVELPLTFEQLGQAWRDWSFIQDSTADNPGEDPFILTSENPLVAKLMQDMGVIPANSPLYTYQGKKSWYLKYLPFFERRDERHEGQDLSTNHEDEDAQYLKYLPGFARHPNKKQTKTTKLTQLFCWAIAGGLSLVAPMLVMRLHHTLLTQLLTTGVSVMLFALAIAAVAGGVVPGLKPVELGPQDVLTATAAYAAVLVVFVSQGS